MESVVCPHCRYVLKRHSDVSGKVCIKCGNVINSDSFFKLLDERYIQRQCNAKDFILSRMEKKMPIDDSKTRMQFDFCYVMEDGTDVPLRFHYTEEFGKTVSFLDENGSMSGSLPAILFQDVANYLVNKELLPSVYAPANNAIGVSADISRKSLCLPSIQKNKTKEDDFDPSSIPPVESLGTVSSVHSGIMTGTISVKEENLDDVLAERTRAVEKYSNNNKSKIRPKE